MLLKLLHALFHHSSPAPLQSDPSDDGILAADDFYRALREGNQDPALLVAHARWLFQREPLLAAELLQEANRRQPDAPAPLRWLGVLHLELGNYQSAAESFHAALLRDENNLAAWDGLGRARRRQERLPEAEYADAQVSRLCMMTRPVSTDFLVRPVIPALPTSDEWMDWKYWLAGVENNPYPLNIEHSLQAHVTSSPKDISPRATLALWLLQHARPQAAFQLALDVCSDTREHLGAHLALASTQAALGHAQAALATCRHGLSLHPADTDLAILHADCLGVESIDAALSEYRQILARHPAPPAPLLNNYGYVLNQLERFGEAVAPLSKAIELEPNLQKVKLNLAYALTYIGQRSEALALLDTLLAKEPNHFEARWFRSHLRLAMHDLPGGWRDYRYRFVASATTIRPMPMPRWTGNSLDKCTSLLITAEQGIGDEIMFASCLGALQSVVQNISLECDPRLMPLFARSFPNLKLVAKPTTNSELPIRADFALPAGDLPGMFRTSIESFRSFGSPYLLANPERSADFRERLAALGPGLKIGISWRGGAANTRHATRSLRLAELFPILDVPGCQFVSLQYGNCATELDTARGKNYLITSWPDAIADLDAFAALVSALDLVISVCSAPAHFCGGLGKPGWILTPFASEWRYTAVDDHMIWYPSITLFQQTEPSQWNPVIVRMANSLRGWVNRLFGDHK